MSQLITGSEKNDLISNKIHAIDKLIISIFNNEVSRYGLTFQQSIVIISLAEREGEKVYQKNIEAYLNLKNSSVTSLVKNMISNDFIYRIKDENDGRYFHLHLTPKSMKIKDDLAETLTNTQIYIETILEGSELKAFQNSLNKLETKLKRLTEKASD